MALSPELKEVVDKVEAAVPIADVMKRYSTLKPVGGGFVCCCPFHNEKTPSCHIYPDHFHCYGCGVGGDVIQLIRLAENISWFEALISISKEYNVQLPTSFASLKPNPQKEKLRKRLYQINHVVSKFWFCLLFHPDGKFYSGVESCTRYLIERRISPQVAKKFALGYAPGGGTTTVQFLLDNGFNEEEILKAGLAQKNQYGLYDMFRERLIFPIVDIKNNICGFSGRTILQNPPDYEPKYKNTPETEIYKKGNMIFAFNYAKNSACKDIILTEGNFDVLSLYQAGFDNVCASLGTALTTSQASIIAKSSKTVFLARDGDKAGIKAAEKDSVTLINAGTTPKVLLFPNDIDPDIFIKEYGRDGFSELLSNAVPGIHFALSNIEKEFNLPEDNAYYVKKAISLISGIKDDFEREKYIQLIHSKTGFSLEILYKNVKNIAEEKKNNFKRSVSQNFNYNNSIAAVSPEERAESGIIYFLLNSPDKVDTVFSALAIDDFLDPVYKKVYEIISIAILGGVVPNLSLLGSELETEEYNKLSKLYNYHNELTSLNDENLNFFISAILNKKTTKLEDLSEEMLIAQLVAQNKFNTSKALAEN